MKERIGKDQTSRKAKLRLRDILLKTLTPQKGLYYDDFVTVFESGVVRRGTWDNDYWGVELKISKDTSFFVGLSESGKRTGYWYFFNNKYGFGNFRKPRRWRAIARSALRLHKSKLAQHMYDKYVEGANARGASLSNKLIGIPSRDKA